MSSITSHNGFSDRRPSRQGFGATPIHQLPVELLAHVLAQLPPSSLSTAQRVCRAWNQVIEDEASWRSAFETYFAIHADGRLKLGRRMEPSSWRSEYIARVALLHRWSKSRTPALTYNANVGPLAGVHITLPAAPIPTHPSAPSSSPRTPNMTPTLLALSLRAGVASQSTPFTGKTSKSLLQSTPCDNFGRPTYLPLVPATSFAISPDGGRIVWGMRDGSLRFCACPGNSTRGWAGGFAERGEVRPVPGHREGTAVSAIAFPISDHRTRTDHFVSAGQDGQVIIWQLDSSTAVRDRPSPARRVWTGRIEGRIARTEGGPLPVPTCVAFDSGWPGRHGRHASVAVGLGDGSIRWWTGIDLEDLTSSGIAPPVVINAADDAAIGFLRLDADAEFVNLMVHAVDKPHFDRYFLASSASAPQRTRFGHRQADHLGALSAFATDFAPVLNTGVSTPALESKIVAFVPEGVSTPVTESHPSANGAADRPNLESSTPQSHGTTFGQRKFVIAGDAHGRTFVWDWQAPESNGVVNPQQMIQGFETRVTAIELAEAIVYIGGLDGTIRCYDLLTASLLRTLKDRSAPRQPSRLLARGLMEASDEERWMVSHIRASRDAMVAAVGGRIIAWKLGSDVKKKGKGVGMGKMSARSERYRSDLELRQEVRESLDSLTEESRERLNRLAQEQRVSIDYGLPPSLDNLTEEEAVALAMMLSAEDEEARWFSDSRASSVQASPAFGPVPAELLDMEGLSLDDLSPPASRSRSFGNRHASTSRDISWEDESELDEYASPIASTSRGGASSLSVPTSPTLRGISLGKGSPSSSAGRSVSYSWKPASTNGSPSFTSWQARSPTSSVSPNANANAKIQVSPRLGPTYGSAVPAGPVPDMSADLWPTAGSTCGSSATSVQATEAALSSTNDSVTPTRRGWNDVARSGSASPSSTSPAPTLSYTRAPSGLSTQLSKNVGGQQSAASTATATSTGSTVSDWERAERESREDELRRQEEEELRFAMELSLAEAQSRGQT